MAGIGSALLNRLLDEKCNSLSGSILSILELLIDQQDSRFISARTQILNKIGEFKRCLLEEMKSSYEITSLSHETIVVRDMEKSEVKKYEK